jgi:hypothetical protein
VLQLSLWRAAIRLARRGEWQELKRDAKAMLWRF